MTSYVFTAGGGNKTKHLRCFSLRGFITHEHLLLVLFKRFFFFIFISRVLTSCCCLRFIWFPLKDLLPGLALYYIQAGQTVADIRLFCVISHKYLPCFHALNKEHSFSLSLSFYIVLNSTTRVLFVLRIPAACSLWKGCAFLNIYHARGHNGYH